MLAARPVDHIPVKDAGGRVGLLRVVLGSGSWFWPCCLPRPRMPYPDGPNWSKKRDTRGSTPRATMMTPTTAGMGAIPADSLDANNRGLISGCA